MREMKDSGVEWIGDIPEDWEVTLLSVLFKERKNKNFNLVEKNLLSLSYGKIIKKNIEDNQGLLPSTFENYNIIKSGDIVFRLTDLQNDKRSLRTGLCTQNGIITSAYNTLYLYTNDNYIYMSYLFRSYDLIKVFYTFGDGVRQSMGYNDLKKIRILKPPIEKQIKIANYLDQKCEKIDSTIEKQGILIEKLKEYKQALITETVTKGLNDNVEMVESGVEWVGEIPSHWEITKVGYLTLKIGSGKTPTGGAEVYLDNGVLFIRSQNVYNTGLHLNEATYISDEIDNEMRNTRVYKDDVLLNITGGSIGRSCIYSFDKYANVNQHVCIIRVRKNMCIPKYMNYFWISKVGQVSIDIVQTGANREGLNFEQISKTLIPFVPLKEQQQIANYLDKKCEAIDKAIEQKQQVVEKLTEYKKSLIYEVVTGKKEV